MARTITIDGVQFVELRLVKGPTGEVTIYGQYNLRSGTRVVQSLYQDVTARLSAARKTAAASLFDSVAVDISTAELA